MALWPTLMGNSPGPCHILLMRMIQLSEIFLSHLYRFDPLVGEFNWALVKFCSNAFKLTQKCRLSLVMLTICLRNGTHSLERKTMLGRTPSFLSKNFSLDFLSFLAPDYITGFFSSNFWRLQFSFLAPDYISGFFSAIFGDYSSPF